MPEIRYRASAVTDDQLCLAKRSLSYATVATVLFKSISGNVIGIVEAPEIIDPQKPAREQYLVKIGVIDPRGKLPKKDARMVILELQDYVLSL